MSTRDHILNVPKAVFGLRIAQLVIAVVILGLAAFGVTFFSFDGDGLTLFTALASMIIVVYYLVATIAMPIIYNYWAVLGVDIFAVIFWLISFALLASEVAAYQIVYDTGCSYTFDGYCYKKRGLNLLPKRATTNAATYRNALAAASGLGGLEFLLFIVTLVFTSLYLHRHRTAGGHCMPGTMGTASVRAETKPVELHQNEQQPTVDQPQPV